MWFDDTALRSILGGLILTLSGCGDDATDTVAAISPILDVPSPAPTPVVTVPVPLFSAPQKIGGVQIDVPYTMNNGSYKFDYSVNTFYIANDVLSVLPALYSDNTSDSKRYDAEFAYKILSPTSAEKISSVVSTQHVGKVLVADFNRDGYSDVYIADTGWHGTGNISPGGQSKLLFGSPTGMVDKTSNLPQVLDFTHSAAVGDIDSDGDVDIYVGNLASENPYFLINDSRGNFTVNDLFPTNLETKYFTSSYIADLNGDKKPELILGGDQTGVSMILEYNGKTYDVKQLLILGDDTKRVITDILTADLDGNGTPEIAFQSTSIDPFYRGTRIDVFSLQNGQYKLDDRFSTIVSEEKWNDEFYFTDVDDNGTIDIVSTGQDTKILLNNGNSLTFSNEKLPFEQYVQNVEMWDLNNDGKLDILYTETAPFVQTGLHTMNVYVMFG